MIGPGAPAPALAGQPVFGLPFELSAAARRGPVIVAFLGALSAAATLDNLARLTAIWPTVDAELGGLVAITRSPLEAARDFVPRHHVLFPMLVDERGEFTTAWGVGQGGGVQAALRRAQPEFLRRAVSVMRNGQPLPEANRTQLAAAFVVNRECVVAHAWYARALSERIDADALLGAACA